MSKKWQSLLMLALVAALIFGAFLVYRKLSSRVSPEETKAGTAESIVETGTEKSEYTETGNREDESSTKSDTSEVSTSEPEKTSEEVSSAEEIPENQAPDFQVKDAEGNIVQLSDFRGKPVIINFWATWCPPCCNELPGFNEAFLQYGEQITFMMVDLMDGYLEMQRGVMNFLEKNGYSFPVYYDTEENAVKAYDVYSIPLTIFINEKGEIIDQHLGSMEKEVLITYIEELLK